MPRKLKTYITNLGFFELALAAPSMKAALEAWGMGHNAFHQGFARETDDPKIVAATMAKPGVVLKRPVGTKGPFQENATLPKDWKLSPSSEASPKAKTKASPSSSAAAGRGKKTLPERKTPSKAAAKADRQASAAIISFEKEKARREREREKQAALQDARREKQEAARQREAAKAQAALDRGEARYAKAMAAIETARDALDRRAADERQRWDKERTKLKSALRGAES